MLYLNKMVLVTPYFANYTTFFQDFKLEQRLFRKKRWKKTAFIN